MFSCELHLSRGEVDCVLGEYFGPEYRGATKCEVCLVKNKFKNRAKFLGHVAHKHMNEEWLDFVLEGFMNMPAGGEQTPLTPQGTVEAIRNTVRQRMQRNNMSLQALRGTPARAPPIPSTVMEEEEDGYKSDGSNNTNASASATLPYAPEAVVNTTLGNETRMKQLRDVFTLLFKDCSEEDVALILKPDDYLRKFRTHSSIQCVEYMKKEKAEIDYMIAVDKELKGEVKLSEL